MLLLEIFWVRTAGMERLEEYADEETPFNEQSNSRRELVQEEITKILRNY